jgi:hypothetical protein
MMQEKLIAYSLGTLEGEERLKVEEALLQSTALLAQFISIKRSLEADDSSDAAPSPALRNRLRRDIEKEFGKKRAPFFEAFLHFSFRPALGVAIALMIVTGVFFSWYPLHHSENLELKSTGISVDSANQTPVTLNFL